MAFPEVVRREQWLARRARSAQQSLSGRTKMSDPLAIMKTCLTGHPTRAARLASPSEALASQ